MTVVTKLPSIRENTSKFYFYEPCASNSGCQYFSAHTITQKRFEMNNEKRVFNENVFPGQHDLTKYIASAPRAPSAQRTHTGNQGNWPQRKLVDMRRATRPRVKNKTREAKSKRAFPFPASALSTHTANQGRAGSPRNETCTREAGFLRNSESRLQHGRVHKINA